MNTYRIPRALTIAIDIAGWLVVCAAIASLLYALATQHFLPLFQAAGLLVMGLILVVFGGLSRAVFDYIARQS